MFHKLYIFFKGMFSDNKIRENLVRNNETNHILVHKYTNAIHIRRGRSIRPL